MVARHSTRASRLHSETNLINVGHREYIVLLACAIRLHLMGGQGNVVINLVHELRAHAEEKACLGDIAPDSPAVLSAASLRFALASLGVKAARRLYRDREARTREMPFSQLSVDGRSIVSPNTFGGVGGTCVLRGCVPKKYFWYASHYAHELHNSRGYGWDVDVKGHNWKTLLTKKRAEIEA